MKKYIALILTLLCAAVTQAQESRGSVNFKNVSISQTLALYSQLSDMQLVIEPGVTNQWKQINIQIQSATKKESAKLLEKALLEQADIVITPLDDKRASVKLVKK